MKHENLRFQLFILVIALAISLASLITVSNASASQIQGKALATCSALQYTTSCKRQCQPSNPNGCGTAQWSYICAWHQQLVYSNGKKMGSFIFSGSSCSVSPGCVTSCS